jgi:hypothetical protein
MLLPFMLLMTDRVPSGDFTTGATPTSSPGSFANVVEESDRDKHHEQRERHRGAVAEVKLPERIVVDVQLQDVRGVRRSPLGGDLDDVEHLERADHREDDDHGEDGAQERNGQPPEHLDLAGTVEPTGLVDLVRDRLQPRHDQDRAPWWGRASFSSGAESVTNYDLFGRSIRDAFDEHAFGSANGCEIVIRSHTFEDWARGAAASVIDSMTEGTLMGAP